MTPARTSSSSAATLLLALLSRIDRVCLWLGSAAMLLMLVCISVQIVARYIFAAPPAWTEELARYAMIWGAMLGATCAYYRRLDPTLSAASQHMTRRQRQLRQGVETLAVGLFIGPVLYYGPATIARLLDRPTETLEVSTGLVLSIIPASMAIILFYALCRFFLAFTAGGATEETGS